MKKGIASLLGIGFSAALVFLPTINASAHTVESGDTMSEIAKAHDLSLTELKQMNPQIDDVHLIYVGEYVETVPGSPTPPGREIKRVTEVEPIKQISEEPKEARTESKPTKQVIEKPVVKEQPTGKTITVEATAYSTNQPSLSDYTFTGINLRENPNVIAVDPNVIPLGSKVEVPGFGVFIAGDTGSAIKGHRIDIHITDLNQAINYGRQTIQVKILN